VIVDGRSQAHSADHPFRAFDTPVPARWHSSERYDLVDNLYALGYGDHENGRDVNTDMSVSHKRTVIFVKAARLWLVEDRMINTGDAEHEYSQLWNFPPVYEDVRTGTRAEALPYGGPGWAECRVPAVRSPEHPL